MKPDTLKQRGELVRQLIDHGFDLGTAERGAEILEQLARLPVPLQLSQVTHMRLMANAFEEATKSGSAYGD